MRVMAGAGSRMGRALAVGLGLLILAACQSEPAPRGPRGAETMGELDPVVAATVNGKPIYVTDVLVEAARRGVIKPGQELDPTSDNFYQILQDLIELRLLAIEAEARDLDKSAEARHRLDQARTVVLAAILDEHLRSTLVSEQQLRRLYTEQARLLSDRELVHARHIQLATEEQARVARTRLDRGEPFETVAFEMSQDRVSGGEGGDLGFVQPDNYPQEFAAALRTVGIGEVAGPVRSESGWHIIRVEERRREEPPTFEALRPRLVQELYWSELRQLVERLRGDARIELFLEERAPGFAPAGEARAPADAARQAPDAGRLRSLNGGAAPETPLPPAAETPTAPAQGEVIPRAPQAPANGG